MATKKKASSAVKAYRQALKRRDHNRQLRSQFRTSLKGLRSAVDAGDPPAAKAAVGAASSLVDKMANKGIIHRNAAARYKSRLVRKAAAKSQAV